jgi:leucyl-tRNA synthetase
VIKPNTEEPRAQSQELFEDEGILVNSGEFTGLASRQAYEKMNVFLEQKNIGKAAVNFKLRDWLISRQRYWGAPIPMIYCDKCGEVPVPEADLPVHLPKNVEFLPTGQSPLTYVEEFKNTTCPKCKGKARRETDTMDTFVDSSWYYLRYISPKNDKIAFVKEDVNRWLPVDQYIGGVEHAILHLLYSRFINKVFYDLGLVGFKEPFAKLFTQGMIVKDGTKMSKSRGNVVAPDYIIDKYGADAMRLYILFIGPPEKEAEWQDEGLQGTARFIQRIMRLVDTLGEYRDSDKTSDLNAIEKDLRRKIHSTIKEVTDDLEGNFQFNTAISRIMELVNQIYKGMQEGALRKSIYRQAVDTVFLLLSPFTPHLSEEVNSIMGNKGSILKRVWPKYDPAYLQADEFEIAVMVNGKVRDKLVVASGAAQAEIEKKVVELEKVIKFLEGKQPKKIIYIVNKMVNIVV